MLGLSLVVQWLKLCASTVGGAGSIPGWGTKIPHALWYSQKTNKLKKKKKKTEVPSPVLPSCHLWEHMVSIIQMGRAGSSMAIPMFAKQMDPLREEEG